MLNLALSGRLVSRVLSPEELVQAQEPDSIQRA